MMWWNRKKNGDNVVNWSYDSDRNAALNGFALLSFPPEPALSYYYDENRSHFMKCPSFKSALQNVYVIKSPIDVEITYQRGTAGAVMNVVKPEKAPPELRKFLINPRFRETQGKAYETFSLVSVPYLFWSQQSMMMDLLPPFLEWNNPNGVRIIPGNFNIGKWKRHIEYAVELQQNAGTFSLKRGDVMFYVKFTPDDPHQRVSLKETTITDDMRKEIQQNAQMKYSYPRCPLNLVYQLREQFNTRLGRS